MIQEPIRIMLGRTTRKMIDGLGRDPASHTLEREVSLVKDAELPACFEPLELGSFFVSHAKQDAHGAGA